MPIEKLLLQPGVDLQSTPLLNQTKFASTQLARFYEGLLQKIGGWQAYCATPCIGTCRAILGWADLSGNTYVATGTEQRLQVLIGGVPQDITPVYAVSNIAVSFSTASGTSNVTIVDTESVNVGDWINLITQVSVGGLVMVGFYQVVSFGSGNYVVQAAGNATATVVNGGVVPQFVTTNGSSTVTVNFPNHGQAAATSSFNVPISTTVGGLTLSGSYVVQAVNNANQFTITASASATSGASAYLNGGDCQIEYLLPTGLAVNTPETGYGIGEYGVGPYGVASSSTATAPMRIWSLDHYGQDLIACPLGGTIYYWQPGTTTPAAVVPSTPPLYNNWILSVAAVQMVMALGAESGGTQYPLLVKWCDAGGLFETNGWVPTATNQAGSFQINSGSQLIFGAANGLSIYLWTDFGLWLATYQGLPYVFSFTEMARECGATSSRAVAISAVGAAWLSAQGFFQLTSGGVQPMECPVWDFYYKNVDLTQLAAITAGLNTAFHEVSWFFPLAAPVYVRGFNGAQTYGYVKWNWLENVWDAGWLARTAWTDASPPAPTPLAVNGVGQIVQHEVGADADGNPITWWGTTHYFDITQGDDFVFVDQLQPDFVASPGATVQLTLLSQDYASGVVTTDGPYPMQPNPGSSGTLPQTWADTNTRGRQIALMIGSQDVGSSLRLGAIRYRYRVDGKI